MSFGDLVYSLFNSKTNSNTGLENSIAISQGKEYKNYKSYKNNNNNIQIDNHARNGGIEGFSGMIGPTSVNTKNQNEESQLQTNEDELNRKISSYANSQRNLIEKTQNYLQNKRIYGKNIFALEAAKMEDIRPSWVGCYKTKNDGLVEQTDLGNNASVNACKVRASDLGYSTFSLRQDGQNGTKCYVGNNTDKAQSGGLATVPVVSHKFSTSEGANIGGLLMNGQIGVYEDDITTNLATDLNAVPNCDISIGGKINANTTVATWGYNCNGTEKSKFTPPPPQPTPETPTPDGYTKYSKKDSGGNDIIKMADGTSLSDLADACNKNLNCAGFNSGGWVKSVIKPQSQITDSITWQGKKLDLYVKNKNTINIDTSKQYRLKNVNSTNCLYNNKDGRFGTYTCIDFNDQYWTLSEVPGQVNTYMFKGVNSYYSLYADTNGTFRTAISDINNPTQQWELVPISGQTDTYQLKNKKTASCLYNNADGRFNMSGCVAAYNDQWWKLIPITEGPKKCDQYKDTDTNLPDECLQQMWKEAGCTTSLITPDLSIGIGNIEGSVWKSYNKKQIKTEANIYANDPTKKITCYAPVPVIKTGLTINTGSLWSKPWVRINIPTWANSLSQLNDGTIISTNGVGKTFVSKSIDNGWEQQPLSVPVKSIIQLQDGRYLGVGKNDNSLYIKNNLNEKWNGFNPSNVFKKNMVRYIKVNANPVGECLQISQVSVYSNGVNIAPGKKVSAPNVYSSDAIATNANDGTLSTKDYPNIYHSACKKGDYWQLDLGKEYDVDEIVYYNRRDCCQTRASGMVVQIFDNNMSQSQFTQGNFTLNSDMKQVITLNNTQTPPSGCCVLSIVQLNNGSLIGVGTDNYLWRRESINDTKWKQIKCPSSCCVTSISKLSDGYTMVAVGTNGYIYTRVDGEGWKLVDQSMKMSAVTQLKDGTILGFDQNGNFFKK